MITAKARKFKISFQDTKKTINIKPKLNKIKTLKHIKERFDIPYNCMVIGLRAKKGKDEVYSLNVFLDNYNELDSNEFELVIADIKEVGFNQFKEYPQSDEISKPYLLIKLTEIDELRRIDIQDCWNLNYFYKKSKKLSFSYYGIKSTHRNLDILTVNDVIYKNQFAGSQIDSERANKYVLTMFLNLTIQDLKPDVISTFKQIVKEQTHSLFILQQLKYFNKNLLSYSQLLSKCLDYIKSNTKTMKIDKRPSQINILSLNDSESPKNNYSSNRKEKKKVEMAEFMSNQTKKPKHLQRNLGKNKSNQLLSANRNNNMLDLDHKVSPRDRRASQYSKTNKQNSNIEGNKNNQLFIDDGKALSAYNSGNKNNLQNKGIKVDAHRINMMDFEDIINHNYQIDSPPTSPNDTFERMGKFKDGDNEFKIDFKVVPDSQPKAKPIAEVSENESSEIHNIYDDDSSNEDPKEEKPEGEKNLFRFKTETADFNKQPMQRSLESDLIKIEEEDSMDEIYMPQNRLQSDQNMRGLEINNDPDNSNLKININVVEHKSKTTRTKSNTVQLKSSFLLGQKLRKFSEQNRKRFSFQDNSNDYGIMLLNTKNLIEVQNVINENLKEEEPVLIGCIMNLKLNDKEKKLAWSLFRNQNSDLFEALDQYKIFQEPQILFNVIKKYSSLIDVTKQETEKLSHPLKAASFEICKNLLDYLVAKNKISGKLNFLILKLLLENSLVVLGIFEVFLVTNNLNDFIESLQSVEEMHIKIYSENYIEGTTAFAFKSKEILYLSDHQLNLIKGFKKDLEQEEYNILVDLCKRQNFQISFLYNSFMENQNLEEFIYDLKELAKLTVNEIELQDKRKDYQKSITAAYDDRKFKIDMFEKLTPKMTSNSNKQFINTKILENDLVLSGITEYYKIFKNEAETVENMDIYFKTTFMERKYKKVFDAIERSEFSDTQIHFIQRAIKKENEPFLISIIKMFDQNGNETQFIEQLKVVLEQKCVI